MQQWHGLSWEFSPLTNTCTFMDMTITIAWNKISTTIYKKHKTSTSTSHPPLHTRKASSVASSLGVSSDSTAYASTTEMHSRKANSYTPAYSVVDTLPTNFYPSSPMHTSVHWYTFPVTQTNTNKFDNNKHSCPNDASSYTYPSTPTTQMRTPSNLYGKNAPLNLQTNQNYQQWQTTKTHWPPSTNSPSPTTDHPTYATTSPCIQFT